MAETKKPGVLKLKGKIVDKMPGTKFKVQVELGESTHELIGYISGKMRMYYIKLNKDDIVDIEVSPHDLTKGRITYRH
jgi:translation initiation factor IF-1